MQALLSNAPRPWRHSSWQTKKSVGKALGAKGTMTVCEASRGGERKADGNKKQDEKPIRLEGSAQPTFDVGAKDLCGEVPEGGRPTFSQTLLDNATSRLQDAEPSPQALEQWAGAYNLMTQEALSLGIPKSAVPVLPKKLTAHELRAARERLEGMIQSFLSAAL